MTIRRGNFALVALLAVAACACTSAAISSSNTTTSAQPAAPDGANASAPVATNATDAQEVKGFYYGEGYGAGWLLYVDAKGGGGSLFQVGGVVKLSAKLSASRRITLEGKKRHTSGNLETWTFKGQATPASLGGKVGFGPWEGNLTLKRLDPHAESALSGEYSGEHADETGHSFTWTMIFIPDGKKLSGLFVSSDDSNLDTQALMKVKLDGDKLTFKLKPFEEEAPPESYSATFNGEMVTIQRPSYEGRDGTVKPAPVVLKKTRGLREFLDALATQK